MKRLAEPEGHRCVVLQLRDKHCVDHMYHAVVGLDIRTLGSKVFLNQWASRNYNYKSAK